MPPLIVIVGETASGKSALALHLAEKFGGELICADAWTVYCGFNIGTAKPTVDDQARVPHHLLDITNPREGFSAVIFKKLALQAISDIVQRDKLPIMVGGAGLYIDSILFDYSFLPAASPALREELNALSLPAVIKRAEALGLDTEGIDMRNKRRLIRLIENNGIRPTRHGLRSNTLILGRRLARDELEKRVKRRIDTMLADGLEAEARALAHRYGWAAEPMKGIGYKEWEKYFAGHQNYEETYRKIISDTLGLAKRQRTWFKRNKSIQWVSDQSNAVDIVTTFLNK